MTSEEPLTQVLEEAVGLARSLSEGHPAEYIPELSSVPLEATSAALCSCTGERYLAGDAETHQFTLQSAAKLILLVGLLEERGPGEVFSVVGSEPSGTSFASLARLETHGPTPANPLVNSGAIALCAQLEGSFDERRAWLLGWAERLLGETVEVDSKVLNSEQQSGDRNRSIAYFLKNEGVIRGSVDEVLELYFSLCSLRVSVGQAAYLPAVLANGGQAPGSGARIVSEDSASCAVSLMATCGMYDESGAYLASTGMPAKSGVSGVIVAVAPARAGIAVSSPRVNSKGGSVRGHAMLRHLSARLRWHFALPPSPRSDA